MTGWFPRGLGELYRSICVWCCCLVPTPQSTSAPEQNKHRVEWRKLSEYAVGSVSLPTIQCRVGLQSTVNKPVVVVSTRMLPACGYVDNPIPAAPTLQGYHCLTWRSTVGRLALSLGKTPSQVVVEILCLPVTAIHFHS